MYGDHHVIEVRRIMLELPGVEDVYASSSFHTLEVTVDPARTSADTVRAVLEEAGYLGEMISPVEDSAVKYVENGDRSFFRHTTVYENVRQVVSFQQNVSYLGRPLWPCPGMGAIRANRLEEE
jgi:copper chaperone CopZ